MKKKKRCQFLIAITLFLLLGLGGVSQAFEGHWKGVIDIPGQPLEIHVYLEMVNGNLEGQVDIPIQGAMGIPLRNFAVEESSISFTLDGIPGDPQVLATMSDEGHQLQGTFQQSNMSFPISLERQVDQEEKKEEKRSQEEILESIKEYTIEMLDSWDVPGVSIGIIYRDKVILTEGFGYRDLESGLLVTPETLFAIGSSTKAFTTASAALMVEEGHLSWDTPVIEYLPWFRLQDQEAMLNTTLRDMALHRTGLSRHDLAWYGQEIPREEHLKNIQYLESTFGFREQFLYNNFMYTAIGYLAGEAAGMEWEELIQERFFNVLGMNKSNFSVEVLKNHENAARPYNKEAGEITPMAFRSLSSMGPAGSINSNVIDMLQWVNLFLQQGKHNNKQVLSPVSIHELTRPQLVLPTAGYSEIRFSNYALGWMVDDYRGEKLIHHGGNIDGFSALVAMVPAHRLGMVVLSNLNGTPLPSIITYRIIDELLGDPPIDWSSRLHQEVAMMPEELIQPPRQIPDTLPSRSLSEFGGFYKHPAYGEIRVQHDPDRDTLALEFRDILTPLEHWHYDVFTAKIPSIAIAASLPIHFLSGIDGYIKGVEIPLDFTSNLIHFGVTADPGMYDPGWLSQFIGVYEVFGVRLNIRLVDDTLVMDIELQGTVELIPERGMRFSLKDMPGGAIEFFFEDDQLGGLYLTQPNGTFTAPLVKE